VGKLSQGIQTGRMVCSVGAMLAQGRARGVRSWLNGRRKGDGESEGRRYRLWIGSCELVQCEQKRLIKGDTDSSRTKEMKLSSSCEHRKR